MPDRHCFHRSVMSVTRDLGDLHLHQMLISILDVTLHETDTHRKQFMRFDATKLRPSRGQRFSLLMDLMMWWQRNCVQSGYQRQEAKKSLYRRHIESQSQRQSKLGCRSCWIFLLTCCTYYTPEHRDRHPGHPRHPITLSHICTVRIWRVALPVYALYKSYLPNIHRPHFADREIADQEWVTGLIAMGLCEQRTTEVIGKWHRCIWQNFLAQSREEEAVGWRLAT